MREMDRIECEAFGRTPKQALRSGLSASDWTITALVDGKPAAMFGVATVSAIEGLGRPWMLGTDEVYRHGKALLTLGPSLVRQVRDSFPEVRNLVSAGNTRAIRLLGRWGFTLEDDIQMIGGVPFREFWMVR
jgi:hypothetical protein